MSECPDYRGVLRSECPDYRGVLMSECPDYRGVLMSECAEVPLYHKTVIIIILYHYNRLQFKDIQLIFSCDIISKPCYYCINSIQFKTN